MAEQPQVYLYQNKVYKALSGNQFRSSRYHEPVDLAASPASYSQNSQLLNTDVNWGILRVCVTDNPFSENT